MRASVNYWLLFNNLKGKIDVTDYGDSMIYVLLFNDLKGKIRDND